MSAGSQGVRGTLWQMHKVSTYQGQQAMRVAQFQAILEAVQSDLAVNAVLRQRITGTEHRTQDLELIGFEPSMSACVRQRLAKGQDAGHFTRMYAKSGHGEMSSLQRVNRPCRQADR